MNAQITEKIGEIKDTRPKKAEKPQTDAKGRVLRPKALQRQIKILEEKIETVPMNFQAEQKLMKQIKALKKQHDALDDQAGMSAELKQKSKEIDQLKKSANEFHAKVTVIAKESQDFHEKMLQLSEEIEVFKKEEETVYKEFLQHKEEYVKLAGNVKGLQQEQKKQRKAERDVKLAEKKKQEAEQKKTLQERAKEAEEKMSKGKKLTTEDLLALQGAKD